MLVWRLSLSHSVALVVLLLVAFVGDFVVAVSVEEDVRISFEQKKAIDKLRSRILPYIVEDWMKEDIYLVRWLRVAEFDIPLAESRLLENIKWRKDDNILTIDNEDFSDVAVSYPYLNSGSDKEGRPLFIAFVGEWDLRNAIVTGRVRRIYRYIHKELEKLSSRIRTFQREGKNVTQAVLILDLDQFNMVQHACIRCLFTIVEALQLYETHYPGMADKILIVNAPPTVNFVVELVRQTMSKEMQGALKIYGTNKAEVVGTLQKYIDRKYLPVELGGTLTRE